LAPRSEFLGEIGSQDFVPGNSLLGTGSQEPISTQDLFPRNSLLGTLSWELSPRNSLPGDNGPQEKDPG